MSLRHFAHLLFALLAGTSVLGAATIEKGRVLEVRLRQPIASYSSKPGTQIQADLIAPVLQNGEPLLPQGSRLRGELADVKRVGYALKHQRASLLMKFDSIELPDGTTIPIQSRVVRVDNARETVDETGRVVGIRATAPLGPRAAGIARNLFIWDPMIQGVILAASMAVIRFPESEIHFPTGTELMVELTAPLEVERIWTIPLPKFASTPAEQQRLEELIRRMTPRTVRENNRKSGDFVNLVLVGEREWIERAFGAAGYVQSDQLSKKTGWMTFRSVAESRNYPSAPMSSQLLDGKRALYQYSKSLNSFSKRHHLRVFEQPEQWNGRPVLAASSTEDIAISFSFSKSKFLHLIDRNIDNERAKIVNDLVYTGCIDSAQLKPRPWVPSSAFSPHGEEIHTDGQVAILEFNPCRSPQVATGDEPELKTTGNGWQRGWRQFFLIVGTDFTYNNPVIQAGKGLDYLRRHFWGRPRSPQPTREDTLAAVEGAGGSAASEEGTTFFCQPD